MDITAMEKALMAIYDSSALQRMRRLQEQIDMLNNMTYPMHEYAAKLNNVVKMGITPPELRFVRDWLDKNQTKLDNLTKTTALEEALRTYAHNISFGVSRIKITENSTNEHLLLNSYPENSDEEEKEEIKKVDNAIVSEILKPNSDIVIPSQDISKIIVLPINDDVLKYLSDNPEELFKLSSTQFEDIMAEIYSRLGYDVTQTKKTRDGGKDLIIKIPDALVDIIYYVECKKFSPKNPVGIGIVKGLAGTLLADRVNGGIIATTSRFTKDAREFILNNNMQYQIQMHDYNRVQSLLKHAVQTKKFKSIGGQKQ